MRAKDEKKEDMIREKAIQLLVEEGLHGFSMQKLGLAAGLSPSTIYIYYRSKEDLFAALYRYITRALNRSVLAYFEPGMSLEQGLWHQWLSRYYYIKKHPLHFRFTEQLGNTPQTGYYSRDGSATGGALRRAMVAFIRQATQRGELARMKTDTFWALAYGPFYILIKFHLDKSVNAGTPFSINEAHLRDTFERALRSLSVAPQAIF
jgi:AcrR family transcriptional regulator